MEEAYRETHRTWNKVAQRYEDMFMELNIYDDSYDLFIQYIQSKAPSILEIGCGPGNVTRYLSQKLEGSKILGIDVAENMIELAKKNVPSANFNVLDMRDISQIEDRFDGVVCGFAIPYLSKTDTQALIHDVAHVLNENGCFYLSYVEGIDGDSGFKEGSSGDRTYFYYHNRDEVEQNLRKAGFSNLQTMRISYERKDAEIEWHTAIVAQKE